MPISNEILNKKEHLPGFLYLFLGLISGAFLFVTQNNKWEWILFFFIGMFLGHFFSNHRNKCLIGGFLLILLIIFMDPLLKPILDPVLNVNTVSTYLASLTQNGISYTYYLVGFIFARYIKKKIKPQ